MFCLSMEKVQSSCSKAGWEWSKQSGLWGSILSCQWIPIPAGGGTADVCILPGMVLSVGSGGCSHPADLEANFITSFVQP